MSHPRAVEVHFIDGPLEGTRRMMSERELTSDSVLVHREVARGYPIKEVATGNNMKAFTATIYEFKYLWRPIPPHYGTPRFIAFLEQGAH